MRERERVCLFTRVGRGRSRICVYTHKLTSTSDPGSVVRMDVSVACVHKLVLRVWKMTLNWMNDILPFKERKRLKKHRSSWRRRRRRSWVCKMQRIRKSYSVTHFRDTHTRAHSMFSVFTNSTITFNMHKYKNSLQTLHLYARFDLPWSLRSCVTTPPLSLSFYLFVCVFFNEREHAYACAWAHK